jgi:hypothetical protein
MPNQFIVRPIVNSFLSNAQMMGAAERKPFADVVAPTLSAVQCQRDLAGAVSAAMHAALESSHLLSVS